MIPRSAPNIRKVFTPAISSGKLGNVNPDEPSLPLGGASICIIITKSRTISLVEFFIMIENLIAPSYPSKRVSSPLNLETKVSYPGSFSVSFGCWY